MKPIVVAALSALVFASVSFARPMKEPYKGSEEFERMKQLAGTWKGEMGRGEGRMPVTVEYRVVSGGSAIEERTFAGTPREMVTMYYDEDGKLAMTHYCSLHNRPGMVLKSSNADSITFDFDPSCGVDPEKELHMHALKLTFKGDSQMTQTWTLYEDGNASETHPIALKRVGQS